MPNNYRLAKVSSLLKKEITLILQNDLENDLIRDHFVNISKIDLSGDLQHCKIYITSTAQEKVRKEIVSNLNTAKSSIRHSLGKRIEMRRVPEIIFKDDVVLDKGLSVLKLLDELKNKNQNHNVEDKDAKSWSTPWSKKYNYYSIKRRDIGYKKDIYKQGR